MSILRYSARVRAHNKGALFPLVMASLLGLWTIFAMAIACGPKLAVVETENTNAATSVSCEPTNGRKSGELLRCIVELDPAIARDI